MGGGGEGRSVRVEVFGVGGGGGAVAHVYVREELVPDRRLNLSNSCPQQSFQEEKEEKC